MNSKKVSVLIPCYNSAKWIERCISSFVKQTIGKESIELLLVDDCSEDDTWNVLCEMEQRYPDMLIIIRSEEHIAPGGARNLALAYASAPYVAMVDSDDWVEPDFLAKMYAVAVDNKCDIVCCNAYRDYGDGRRFSIPYHDRNELIVIDTLEKRKESLLSGRLKGRMLADREYLLTNRILYPSGIVYEDICWNALNYCHMTRVFALQDVLYHYFVNPNSVVLKSNQDYSHDMFTTNYIKWNEIRDRGLYEQMPDEFEFDMLFSYYFSIMKMYKLRFSTIPQDGFAEMQNFILENMPGYIHNPYVKTRLSAGQRELVEFIDKPMGEAELKMLHEILCNIRDI